MDKELIIELYNNLNDVNTVNENGFIELLTEYTKEEDIDKNIRDLISNFIHPKPQVWGYSTERARHIQEILDYYIKKFEIARVFKLIEKNGIEYKVFIALC